MSTYRRFVLTGCTLGLAVEIQYRIFGRFNPGALAAAVVAYPLLVSLSYVGSRWLDRRFVSRPSDDGRRWSQRKADMVWYFVCGFAGLAFEWIVLGNSPGANPQAFQSAMFSMWVTFCYGPRVLTRDDEKRPALKRAVWRVLGAWFVVSSLCGMLIPDPKARFVAILLLSFGAYYVMNGLLIWITLSRPKHDSPPKIVSS